AVLPPVSHSFPTRRSSDLWAHRYPSLAEFTDNIRILEAVAREGLLDAEAAGALRAAWLAYREAQHRLALQALPGRVPADSCAGRSEEHTSELQSRENLVCR